MMLILIKLLRHHIVLVLGSIGSEHVKKMLFNTLFMKSLLQWNQVIALSSEKHCWVLLLLLSWLWWSLLIHYQIGFTNPLMVCCGFGGPPYNFDARVTCGQPGYQVCDEGSRYVSWDGIHYTEAANTWIASKILSTAYSTPRIPFGFFCHWYLTMIKLCKRVKNSELLLFH